MTSPPGLVAEGRRADLLAANNVMAHVPDLNDFVGGMAPLLAPEGVVTVEVPHLLRLVEDNQFDTIYHEHFSYFSLLTARKVIVGARARGLRRRRAQEPRRLAARLCPAQPTPAAGRSARRSRRCWSASARSASTRSRATAASPRSVEETKFKLLEFLIDCRRQGKRVVGYGAPGKGNTLLNYCGIRTDLLEFTVDRNPYKQGQFLPGTHIPIRHPDALEQARPDYILILPWNLKDEIMSQLSYTREWGARCVVPIPEVEVL